MKPCLVCGERCAENAPACLACGCADFGPPLPAPSPRNGDDNTDAAESSAVEPAPSAPVINEPAKRRR